MNAYLNLRYSNDERAKAFREGLQTLGYQIVEGFTQQPKPGDILVTWNRIRTANVFAKVFERAGCKVLVAENATWGNSFAGENWLHIARSLHNTAGMFDYFGPERFDALKTDLKPWRKSGETVILAQRGIGSKPVSMPAEFMRTAMKEHGGRVRKHPGVRPAVSIEQDLAHCGKVITWASGGAVKALMMGVPVVSYYDRWIAAQDNTDQGRLEMLRQLAWAQWTYGEIRSGEAFKRLLN